MIGFVTYSKHHTKINGSLIYKLEVTLRLRAKVLIRFWRESVPWQNRLDHVCPNSEMEIVVITTFQVLSPICIQSWEFEWGKMNIKFYEAAKDLAQISNEVTSVTMLSTDWIVQQHNSILHPFKSTLLRWAECATPCHWRSSTCICCIRELLPSDICSKLVLLPVCYTLLLENTLM